MPLIFSDDSRQNGIERVAASCVVWSHLSRICSSRSSW